LAMKIGESRISKKFLLTLPRAVREALDLRVGDTIEWHVERQRLIVRKKVAKREGGAKLRPEGLP